MPDAETTATPPAAPVPSNAAPESIAPAPPKIKIRKPRQRACDEKDEKNKVCCGHLKRWYDYPPEIDALVGKGTELYRCENCKTLYKPDLSEMPHSYTQRF